MGKKPSWRTLSRFKIHRAAVSDVNDQNRTLSRDTVPLRVHIRRQVQSELVKSSI